MASFTANFIYTTRLKLHFGVFMVPWVKRNSCISRGKSRGYSKSIPLKYIPKSSPINDEIENSHLPLKYLEEQEKHNILKLNLHGTRLDIESRNHDQQRISSISYGYNLEVEEEIEGGFSAVNDDFVEEPEEFTVDFSKRCQGIQDVEKSAIELLAARAYTALELKKKLQRKRFPHAIVDTVIIDFQSRGLINDSLYAETFSRSRWSSFSWGPHRIKQELFKRGVSEVDTEKAIKLVFENDEDQQGSGIAMSKLSIDQLYIQASKQWLRSQSVPRETRKTRIVRWLQYRGFNWSVIKYILQKLESECPS